MPPPSRDTIAFYFDCSRQVRWNRVHHVVTGRQPTALGRWFIVDAFLSHFAETLSKSTSINSDVVKHAASRSTQGGIFTTHADEYYDSLVSLTAHSDFNVRGSSFKGALNTVSFLLAY